MRIRFGECTFDAVRREVRRGFEELHLSPKGFELLRLLIEARPRASSKEELIERLWPGVYVSEASLAGLVTEIRRVIREDAREPHHVRTVHGFGYAFSDGGAAPADEDVVFRLIWGARELALAPGRTSSAAIRRSPFTSTTPRSRAITRASSSTETSRRSRTSAARTARGCAAARLAGAQALRDGDTIRVGPAAMVFRRYAMSGSTATQIE